MTAVTLFDFEGLTIRTGLADDRPVVVVADVCAALGLGNTTMVITRLDPDDLNRIEVIDSVGRSQSMWAVNESGLYDLILRSDKPKAKDFKRWITRDVLPEIRRTGSYGQSAPAAMPTLEESLRGWLKAVEDNKVLEGRVAELEPRAEVADKLLNADGDLSVDDAAKELTRAGIKVGQGRLFSLLAIKKWIFRAPGDGRWRVYQTAIESGVMSVLPMSHYHPKTGVLVLDPPQPRVTPKGLSKLLAEHGAT